MKRINAREVIFGTGALAMLLNITVAAAVGQDKANDVAVEVDWGTVTGTSKTLLTVQVCPEPPMRRRAVIHDQWIAALRNLKMSYARLQPWAPFPKLSIAELEPPTDGHTSWDFSAIDPLVMDFYAAQEGRPSMLNPAIPAWLFDGPPHQYPQDPDEIDWKYEFRPDVGKRLRDPTFHATADYFRRFAEWYVRGEFIDEYGQVHHSGHHLKIDYWEVLNEEEEGTGHEIDPETYTALYDEVVSALRKVDPTMKFSGLALADASSLHYFEYFLNHRNHGPSIPLDMVSYHKYVFAEAGRNLQDWQHDMFADADRFLHTVTQIERIRKRLSPETKTFISELGIMSGDEAANMAAAQSGLKPYQLPDIPKEYWTLGASVFAYTYLGTIREGVDMVGASELVDYPGNVAGTTLIDWNTGEPNAVYRVVKLLHDALPQGAQLVRTQVTGEEVAAQGFVVSTEKKLLLINKSREAVRVKITGAGGARMRTVDLGTGSAPAREGQWDNDEVILQPHAVVIGVLRR